MTHNIQVVDISDGFESDSDGEVPNTKRTPRGRSKRQRMTYDEDDSPDLDPDDTQVLPLYLLAFPCMTTTDHKQERHIVYLSTLSFCVSFLLHQNHEISAITTAIFGCTAHHCVWHTILGPAPALHQPFLLCFNSFLLCLKSKGQFGFLLPSLSCRSLLAIQQVLCALVCHTNMPA